MTATAPLPPRAESELLVDDTMTAGRAIPDVDGPLPERARVVVIGGGIIGASVLHHLVELGVSDAVLLERHRLTSGTSWHAAGLFANVRTSHGMTELARHSAQVYAGLTARSGVDNGYNRRGCIAVARRPERVTELAYSAAMARHHGVEAELLSPAEVAALHPMVEPAGLEGGIVYPADGTVNPGASALGLVTCAAGGGARVLEHVAVESVETARGRVQAVVTDRGRIECETVVVAGGLWSPAILRGTGVPLALHAAEHVWVMTEPVDAPVWELPFVRDLDGHVYVRGYRDRLVVGAFEPCGKPRPLHTLAEPFAFGEFDPDLKHLAPSLERAAERFPALRGLQIARHLNAPESFTPDSLPVVGETPEVRGLFVAAGMNSQGVLLGPGVGRAIAEWIAEGGPTMDIGDLAPGRFGAAQAGAAYLRERTRESLGRLYAMHWPDLQPTTARGLRRTPLHDRLAAAGACFGEVAGWERANWYADPGERPEYVYSYGRAPYFERVAAEHRAARDAVALFDLSSFAKAEIAGPGALAAVQQVFAGDLDVSTDKVVYTTMLNERGGVDIDLTVTRLARDRFLAIAPAVSQRTVLGRLRHHAGEAAVTDLTAAHATLSVMGPRSRELLSRLTDADLGNDAFPFGTAQVIDLGCGPVPALRVSFVGELGWELYPTADLAVTVYDAIVEAGADLGLRHAGYHALDSLRSEKGYRHWPHDVGPADTPIDAGLGFTVAWDKPSFVGRDALLRAREAPRTRRLVHLCLTDPEPLLRHGESVRHRGRPVGRVTSAAYGHHLGCAVGLAMLDDPELLALGDLESADVAVDVAGTVAPAQLSLRPFYDPGNLRLRA
jgi:glycine cleavage system aminomethyltransferase T/glycine/D-amino acid oxidase-like deaminating enzyme